MYGLAMTGAPILVYILVGLGSLVASGYVKWFKK